MTLGILLVDRMGLRRASRVAIAFGAWAEALVLLEVLRQRYPDLDIPGVIRAFAEAGAASIAAGIAAFAALQLLGGNVGANPGKLGFIVELVVASAVGGLVYLGAAVALRIPELPIIVAVVFDLRQHSMRPGRVTELSRPDAWDAFVARSDLGSYLQQTPWARVKAVNGWFARRVVATATPGGGPIGAQILVRRPRPLPWGFAYASRGPVATDWSDASVGAFTEQLRRGLRRIGRPDLAPSDRSRSRTGRRR